MGLSYENYPRQKLRNSRFLVVEQEGCQGKKTYPSYTEENGMNK